MICQNCKNVVPSNVEFCPYCGTAINSYYQNPSKPSNSSNIIVFAVVGVLLFAAIGFGAWYYISQNEKEKLALEQRAREAEQAKKEAEEKAPDTVVVEKVKPIVKDYSTTYYEPENPSVVYIKGNRVNVRDCASMSGGVLGLVKKGERLDYLGTYGDWYEVNYYGTIGYIRKYHTNGKRIAVAQ